ncbi:leucine-rich repeat-containing protein 37A3-like [Cavia porcellus]|uniref:leucine-rich repeat-containing protein 37A3-like n=1 Tax=Cavia porcellus TaxID=10141 RepID=UPI002FE2CAF3
MGPASIHCLSEEVTLVGHLIEGKSQAEGAAPLCSRLWAVSSLGQLPDTDILIHYQLFSGIPLARVARVVSLPLHPQPTQPILCTNYQEDLNNVEIIPCVYLALPVGRDKWYPTWGTKLGDSVSDAIRVPKVEKGKGNRGADNVGTSHAALILADDGTWRQKDGGKVQVSILSVMELIWNLYEILFVEVLPSSPSPKPQHALTVPADPEQLDYPGSSAPMKNLLTPKESTGESLPDPDKFAVLHQGLHDKLVGPQRIPEVHPMLDRHENEGLALPPQLQRKMGTSPLEQAADHQSQVLVPPLAIKSSTASHLVSPLKLKGIAQPWQLAKEVFGAPYLSEYPEHQKQTLKDNTVDLSTDKADHDSLHSGYLENPDERAQPCEHKESSQYQVEAWTKNLEAPQVQSSLPLGKGPCEHSQPAEEVLPSLTQWEALRQHKLFTEDGLHQLSENQEFGVPSASSMSTHLLHLPSFIFRPVDMEVVATMENDKETHPSLRLLQSPGQSLENPEEVETTLFQQKILHLPLGPPLAKEPSPSEQKHPVPFSEVTEEVEYLKSQPEATAQPIKSVNEGRLPVQEDAQTSESSLRSVAKALLYHKVTFLSPDHHYDRPTFGVKPAYAELIITTKPIKEVESSVRFHQEVPAQPLGPHVVLEPSARQHNQPAQPSKYLGEFEQLQSQLETPDPHHEVRFQPVDEDAGLHHKLLTLRVEPLDMEVTTVAEPVKVESSQQMAPDLSSMLSTLFEPWKVQQSVVAQQPNSLIIDYHSLVDQVIPVHSEELSEHSLRQKESLSLSSKPAVSATLQMIQQELSAEPLGPWSEGSSVLPLAAYMTYSLLDTGTKLPSQHSVLSKATVTHVDLELTTTTKPTLQSEPSVTYQEDRLKVPTELSLVQIGPSFQHAEFSEKSKSSPAQQVVKAQTLDGPKELISAATQHEALRLPLEFSKKAKPLLPKKSSPVWQPNPTQVQQSPQKCIPELLVPHEMTLSRAGQDPVQHPTSSSVILQALTTEFTKKWVTGVWCGWVIFLLPLPFTLCFRIAGLILNHNPLSAIEDSSLFQLPALKYLDLGQTHVPLTALENIITMALGLKTLILPSNMVCCLCQFKNDIEVVGKTVKLHCDSTCVLHTTQCVGQALIENLEEALMKVLQARKMSTNTMLTIKPEKASSKRGGLHLSGLVKKQLDTNDESDITKTASFTLPYFLEGNLEDTEKTILPFLRLLLSNTQNGDNSLAYLENSMRNSSAQLGSGNLSLKDKLKTLHFLQKLLNAKIQEILDDTKKKEKTVMLMPSRNLDPQFRLQIFANKVESPETQENSLAEVEGERKMLPSSKTLLKELKHPQQSVFKEERKQKAGDKWAAQPFLEDVTKEGSLRRFIPQEVGQHQGMPRPRKFVENSFRIEPSLTDKQKVTASSFLKHPSMDTSPSIPAKALPKVRKRANDFNYILDLQNANARVKTTEGTKPVLHPGNPHHFHKTHSLMARGTPKAKLSDKLRKQNTHSRQPLVKRSQFSAVRTLTSFPSGSFFSSSGEPSFQETPVSELYAPSELSVESTPVENHTAADTFKGADFALSISVPEETISKDTTHKNHSAAYSAVTAFNLIPAVNYTTKAQWEHPNMGTDSPLKDFTPLSLSSSHDQFEIYINQQLWPLIPNNDIRRLVSLVIRNLLDCSETQVQLACAKLISKTGLLLKLFSEQQKAKVSKAQWDVEHWTNENYIIQSTEDKNEEKEQQSRELTVEVPGFGYKNKLILTVSVTGIGIIVLIIFCLIEIYSQKRASEENEEESSRELHGVTTEAAPTVSAIKKAPLE